MAISNVTSSDLSTFSLLFSRSSQRFLPGLLTNTNSTATRTGFPQLLSSVGTEPLQALELALNASTAHSLISAAQPFLSGSRSVFNGPQDPSTARLGAASQRLVDTLNTALSSSAAANSPRLGAISSYLQDRSSQLAEIGITANASGRLALNRTTLTAALQEDPAGVRETLAGPTGLAQTVNLNARDFLGESLGFPGAIPSNGTRSLTRAVTQGLLIDFLA